MANRELREALRGAEEETFDIIAQVLTSDKWAELLKAPLEHAAAKGNRAFAQKLVRAGAENGQALHEAVRGGHGDVVSDLLENGVPVSAKDASLFGYTPLHVAAKHGEMEIVQLLLVKGADKDSMDNNECTPLFLAALHGRVAVALALMAAGADVTLRYGGFKLSVLHLAARDGHVDIIRAAIKRGADVDAVDTTLSTPLHATAYFKRVEAVNVLLEAGANVDVRDETGWTPLHYAADRTSQEAVLALLKHGADVNTQDKNQETPLHRAARMAGSGRAAEVVGSLLRSGADETILDDQGKAPADVVVELAEDEEDEDIEQDVDRVRELLANAPADRAWRRRGYLVLCRAHPDRVQQIQEISSARAGVARITRSGDKLARTEAGSCAGTAGGSTGGGRSDGDWAVVLARVLGLQEEGIFRMIVGYL